MGTPLLLTVRVLHQEELGSVKRSARVCRSRNFSVYSVETLFRAHRIPYTAPPFTPAVKPARWQRVTPASARLVLRVFVDDVPPTFVRGMGLVPPARLVLILGMFNGVHQ